MSELMSLRYGTPADHVLLADIGRETFSDTFGPDNDSEDMAAYLAWAFGPERQAAELADPAVRFLILELEGQVVGYSKLAFRPAPPLVRGQRPMEIVRFYARRPWIGHGVGPRLMQAALHEAQQAGCDVVWLATWQRNPRAIAFYQKWGFKIVGPGTFQLGSDLQDDWVLARPIG
jgi:GNAT superfamily N-acetyltransferase